MADATGGGAGGGAKPNSIMTAINDPSLANIGGALSSNAGLLIPAATLGYEALTQGNQGPSQTQLTDAELQQAQQLGLQGSSLINTLNTGVLPPGLQSAIQQSTASAKAAIRSQYAQMGLSGSTMEQQAMQQIDQQAAQQTFAQIQQLVQMGVSETTLSNRIYSQLMQSQIAQDNQLSSALTNFAGAAAGSAIRSAAA